MIHYNSRINFSEKQLSDVKTKHHPPEGTFTGSAEAIARKVLEDANGNLGKAVRRITFYVNRAGENCSAEARKAKNILVKRNAREKGKENYSLGSGSHNFNGMPDPNADLDPKTLRQAGIANQFVMLPMANRNEEILRDTLSHYPKKIQLSMADYYIGQAIAAVENYFWDAGFFRSPDDHIRFLERWGRNLLNLANPEYVDSMLRRKAEVQRYR